MARYMKRYTGQKPGEHLADMGRVLLAILFTANLLFGGAALLLGETGRLAKELAFSGVAASLTNFSVLAAVALFCRTVKSSVRQRPAGEYCLRPPVVYDFPPVAFFSLSVLLMAVTALRFQEAKAYYVTTALSLLKVAAVLCPALCGLSFYWYNAQRVFFSREALRICQPFHRRLSVRWSEVTEVVIHTMRQRGGTAYIVTIRSKQGFRSLHSTHYIAGGWRRFEQILQEAVKAKNIPVNRI